MLARASLKPNTDIYSGVATAALFGQELPLVHVAPPVVDADPNAAVLLPTDPRVVSWPNYGNVATGIALAAILGGTSIVGRFWMYDTTSTKWVPVGSLITLTVGAAQGTVQTAARSKKLYWQTTVVTGVVTDLLYGLV